MEKLNQALTSLKWIYSQAAGNRGIDQEKAWDEMAVKMEIMMDEIQAEIENHFDTTGWEVSND